MKAFAWTGIFLAITAINIARLSFLEHSPAGFYVDEAAPAVEALCLAENGTNAYGNERYPLFFNADTGGTHTPYWIYTSALWSKVFGHRVQDFRLIAALAGTITVFSAAWLAYALCGKTCAIFALLLATSSPWGFQFSRIAWDNAFYPMGVMTGLALYWAGRGYLSAILAGFFLSVGMYSYSPGRIVIPLLVFFIGIEWLISRRRSFPQMLTLLTVLAALTVPMLIGLFNGSLMTRFNTVSILAADYRHKFTPPLSHFEVFLKFVELFSSYFHWRFLLVFGDDHNLRHTTGHFGVLSYIEASAILALLLSPTLLISKALRLRLKEAFPSPLLLFFLAVFGVIAALIPAALTWDSMPHAIRAFAAWPFVALLGALGLSLFYCTFPKTTLVSSTLVSTIWAVVFLRVFFFVYPSESEGWFDAHSTQLARQIAATSQDWTPLIQDKAAHHRSIRRFYLMTLAGMKCLETD